MISSDRLTVKAAEALNEALALARRTGNPLVYDAHLLLALLQQEDGSSYNAAQIAERHDLAPVEREIARYPSRPGSATLSRGCTR